MTSLALLAHTAKAAAPAFNGLFFATIATVIPVLFLALAVQGGSYDGLLRLALRIGRDDQAADLPVPLPALRYLPRAMMGIAFVIVAAGFYGETDCILTLYFRRDSHGSGVVVLVAALILTLAVVTGPVSSYLTATDKLSDGVPDPGDGAGSARYGYGDGSGNGESSQPGAGKTDIR